MAVRVTLWSVLALVLSPFPVAAQQFRSAPSVAPPVMAAPPIVTAPAPMPSPSPTPSPSWSQPSPATTPPTVNVPTCRRPEDCPDRSAQEKAREKFAHCVEKSRTGPESLNRETLEDCALGVMSPNKFSEFRRCLSASGTAWDCYRQAYR